MGKKIRFWIINKKNFLRLKINPFRRRKLWFQCHKNFLRMLSHYFSEYIQYIPFWGAIHHYCHKKSNWSWITCISFRLQKINPKLTDIFFVTTSESFFLSYEIKFNIHVPILAWVFSTIIFTVVTCWNFMEKITCLL